MERNQAAIWPGGAPDAAVSQEPAIPGWRRVRRWPSPGLPWDVRDYAKKTINGLGIRASKYIVIFCGENKGGNVGSLDCLIPENHPNFLILQYFRNFRSDESTASELFWRNSQQAWKSSLFLVNLILCTGSSSLVLGSSPPVIYPVSTPRNIQWAPFNWGYNLYGPSKKNPHDTFRTKFAK